MSEFEIPEELRAFILSWELVKLFKRPHEAALLGHDVLVAELGRAGGDANSHCLSVYRTALTKAVNGNRIELLRSLLGFGADPNTTKDDLSLICWALSISDEMAQLLIDSGAVVSARPGDSTSPLHWAVSSRRSVEIIRALVERGADVCFVNLFNNTPLDCALNCYCPETVAYLTPLTRARRAELAREKQKV